MSGNMVSRVFDKFWEGLVMMIDNEDIGALCVNVRNMEGESEITLSNNEGLVKIVRNSFTFKEVKEMIIEYVKENKDLFLFEKDVERLISDIEGEDEMFKLKRSDFDVSKDGKIIYTMIGLRNDLGVIVRGKDYTVTGVLKAERDE